MLLKLYKISGYKKELLSSTFFIKIKAFNLIRNCQTTKPSYPFYCKMQLLSLVSVMALVPAVLSSPVAEFKKIAVRADDRGHEIISGLGARKQAVVDAGGNTRDLAIAMLETTKMTTDYTYGMDR